MALDPNVLGPLLAAASIDPTPDPTGAIHWTKLAAIILTHIETHGVINTSVTVAVPSLGLISATPGAPVTGAAVGTGTGTGTIS